MKPDQQIKLIECPRDAMQGWSHQISTENKVAYLQALLQVGFDTLDCGSFVSPKAIPQMADTKQVLTQLNLHASKTRLLVIVANIRGAEEAILHENVSYLGFPFSISETFQQRNTNSSIAESIKRVEGIQQLCATANKNLVVYLSMAFGNPYGDEYNAAVLKHYTTLFAKLGVSTLSLADTVGLANPEQILNVSGELINAFPHMEIGVHLHSRQDNWQPKFEAALQAGCSRFDGAINGIGGCPMAGNVLIGNMNMNLIVEYLQQHQYDTGLNLSALATATKIAQQIFV